VRSFSVGAVIFDLFETLVTERGRPKYTTRDIALDLNVDYQEFRSEWVSLHNERYLGKLSGTVQVFQRILANLGTSRDENLLITISNKRDECKRKCFEVIEPQILTMLSEIKERGYKIGLISNCSAEETAGFKDSILYDYFDAVALSCEVGIIKPDVGIYEHCLKILGELPYNCLYIGDGESELNGAKRAGMLPLRALWFIKDFVKDFDSEYTYPVLSKPSEIEKYI
jgi:putative hydrolase of the HAD superfamily